MIYLLDAGVLITANNTYYPIEDVPEFWEWLLHMAEQNKVKIPAEIFDEIIEGNKDDPLYMWAKDNKSVLILENEVEPGAVQHVTYKGYAEDLTDTELESLGNDPFLISHALMLKDSCVVTTEVSASSKTRQNRKIPDVCKDLGVQCCDPFSFNKTLGFKTSWQKQAS